MPKVFLAGGLSCYHLHKKFGSPSMDLTDLRENPDDYSLIVLPGGADVNPAYYGHEENIKTCSSEGADERESEAADIAIANGIPLVGICKGGQFLIAKAGGFLYQHVTGHSGNHSTRTSEGHIITVTSCHHQMFGLPLPKSAVPLAWSEERRSVSYELANEAAPLPKMELENVFLPNISALATQWHPEWMDVQGTNAGIYYQFLLSKYIHPLILERSKAKANVLQSP